MTDKLKTSVATFQTVPAAGFQPAVNRDFADSLRDIMNRKGLSASDLARKVWGDVTNDRGYTVARNRDRVGKYLRGYSIPDTKNLNALSKALGVAPEDLFRERNTSLAAPSTTGATVNLTAVPGAIGQSLLELRVILPTALAAEIIALIARHEQKAG